MTTVWIVIIAIVVVAVIVGAVLVLNKRNRAHKHHQAETLREEAVTKTPAIQESELHAQEAEARAERTRLQAERAEHEAAAARQGVDVEQAEYEDRIRQADRVDPAVDHSAPDYTPDTTPAEQATETRPEAGGRHTV
jgi:FtsZ-interacting cell division protein ZipA